MQGRNTDTDMEKRLVDTGRRRGWDELGDSLVNNIERVKEKILLLVKGIIPPNNKKNMIPMYSPNYPPYDPKLNCVI